MRKAIFIDRDGTLNEMVYDENHGITDSPRRPDQVRMIPGAGRFLKEVRAMGYFICVVTNQPGIAKGTLTLPELAAVNHELASQLTREGGRWDELRFCPHHPKGTVVPFAVDCACRKPRPGMLTEAIQHHDIDPASSWMIGDGLTDIQAGHAAGCKAILVTRLKLEQIERFIPMDDGVPDVISADLESSLPFVRADA